MSRKRGPFQVEGDIATHPAVVALRRTRPDLGPVESVDVLKERGRARGVYRLSGGAASGAVFIAKQGRADTIQKERHVYEAVLPSLGVRSLRFLGTAGDECGSLWVLIEAADGAPFDEQDPHHRRLAAEWFARLHTHEWSPASRAGMPVRDLASYRTVLDQATLTLRAVGTTNKLLPPEGAVVVESLEAQLRDLRTHWASFAEGGDPAPGTVVHGDVQPKNMVVSPEGHLLVFDWEHCGLGDPCRDLDPCLDLDAYFGAVSEPWPAFDRERLQRMIVRGEVLRLIDAIGWESVRLASPWWERSVRHMGSYSRDLQALDLELVGVHTEVTP
jgi:hypothetical protein